ncbi:hypothetical protein ACLB6G_20265 [Zhengella sp. ZM62]|uniref:hypothetical protein n=1 Tax=Zhengella sedimenti TaxID=3390035 RepID=UPI0039770A55
MSTLSLIIAIAFGLSAWFTGKSAQTANRAFTAFILGIVALMFVALSLVAAFVGVIA